MLESVPPQLQEALPLPVDQKYDPVKAYTAHRQSLLKDIPDAEPSRLDAYIALRMREKGFKRDVVLETLVQCAPQTQPEQVNRDWRRYAERTIAYAFGIAGDVKLAQGAARQNARQDEKQKDEDLARQQEQERLEIMKRKEAQRSAPKMRMR